MITRHVIERHLMEMLRDYFYKQVPDIYIVKYGDPCVTEDDLDPERPISPEVVSRCSYSYMRCMPNVGKKKAAAIVDWLKQSGHEMRDMPRPKQPRLPDPPKEFNKRAADIFASYLRKHGYTVTEPPS